MSTARKVKHLMDLRILALVLVVFFLSTEARAATFGFYNVTGNDLADAAAGEAQLTVDVTDPGSDQVLFTFHNEGSYNMFINEIYFYDGKLSFDSIINSLGTSYSVVDEPPFTGNPGLAGYKNQTPLSLFLATEADSPGTGGGGIDPGDSLQIFLNIKDPFDFEEILGDIGSSRIVVGIHVQGMGWDTDTDGSEGFVTTPVPGALLLGMLGMSVAGMKLRKFA